MELRDYFQPLRKWWWLIFLATLFSTLAAFAATRLQQPLYEARSTLILGQAIDSPNPSGTEFFLTTQLARTYADIAQRQPVRQASMEALGLDWLPSYEVRASPDTQLLEISVVDTSPERAQAVANTLAEQLVLQSPTSQVDQQRQEFINGQLDSLEAKIGETEVEIGDLQAALNDMVSARQIAETQAQIASLNTKLTTLQTNYATLVDNTQQGAINVLRIIEPALLPSSPINNNTLTTLLLGAVIGFTLATSAAYLMEHLDDSLKTAEEIGAELGAPVLGFIVDVEQAGKKEKKDQFLVAASPRSPVAEAFRGLRTNLEFASVDRPVRTLLVTSANPSDGKSTVAANLALIMAQGNRRVVLVDADLRRPRLHRIFGLTNRFGLTDIFREHLDLDGAAQGMDDVANLAIITSGSLPPNPADLLNSGKMNDILDNLAQRADIVILDSPPILVTDPSVLAAKVDGVLLVTQPGALNGPAARAVREQFARAGARVLGIVVNRIPKGRRGYGGYYYDQYYEAGGYLEDSEQKRRQRKVRRTGVLARLNPLRRTVDGHSD